MVNPFQIVRIAEECVDGAKVLATGADASATLFADATSSVSKLLVDPSHVQAKDFLLDLRGKMSPAGAKMIDSALQTQDGVIVKGLADFYKLPTAEKDILTDGDWEMLQKALSQGDVLSLGKARETLGTISDVRPTGIADIQPTLKESLGLPHWYPDVKLTVGDLG